LWASGRAEAASAALAKAVAMDGRYVAALFNHGLVLVELQRLEEAADAFTKALALAPELRGGRAMRGRTYLALGKTDEAVQDLKLALQMDGSDAETVFVLAQAYVASNQPVAAKSAFCRAAELGHKEAVPLCEQLENR